MSDQNNTADTGVTIPDGLKPTDKGPGCNVGEIDLSEASLRNMPATGSPDAGGTILMGAMASCASRQIVIPGSVTDEDLRKVLDNFVEWVGWDDPTCVPASHKMYERRREILRPRRDKLAKKLARVQAKLDEVEAELRPPELKKAEAREYLAAAVMQMGPFGSIEVLTAALKKKFPKVIIHPKARKETPKGAPAPAAKPHRKPSKTLADITAATIQEGQRALALVRRVGDVLDHEGMTMAEIRKILPEFDTGSIKVALDYLIETGAATSIGKRSDKRFKLLSQGS